jgi:MFS family permease
MAVVERKLVSRWVPRSTTAISVLLVIVGTVNSAVSGHFHLPALWRMLTAQTLGYDSAMMNGLNILPQYKDYFHLNTATTGLNNGALWMGSILGATLIQPASDRYGRKNGILIAALICIVGTIIQSAAHNMATFVIGRILVGIGSELASGPAPSLIAEILPTKLRGSVLGLYFSCFNVGSLISAGINYRVVNISTTWAWRIPSIIQGAFSLLAIALLPFVPESPRWLIDKGRFDEAREVFSIIHGHNDPSSKETEAVFNEVVSVLKKEAEVYPKNPYKELISTKANQHRLIIIVSFGVMVEMFGNFVIS